MLPNYHLTITQEAHNNQIIITMAKIQGLVGGLSGKMGNAVFRQRYGKTIVAQYQPVVSNPNTPAQQNARAAFKLITQLAAIMSPGIGTMGVTKRNGSGSRSGFVAKNYKLIVIDPSPEAAERVTIPMEQLQLTESFRPLTNLKDSSTAPVGDDTAMLRVDANNLPVDVASVRFVEVEYITTNGANQAAIRSITDVPVENRAATLEKSATAGENITVLAYGLIPSGTTREKVDFDNIHTPSDDDFISAVELDKMVRDGEMTVTMTSGINVTIPNA